MASIAWLASLPQGPLYSGNQESIGANKLTFKPDYGDAIERVRFTAVSDPSTLTFQMTLAQYRLFLTFFKTTLNYGVTDFNLLDQNLGVVKDYHIDSAPVMTRNAPDGVLVSFNVLRRP
jgi:hypothetical protein